MNFTLIIDKSWITDKSGVVVPIRCEFYCSPGHPGTHWEPPEPAEMVLEECWVGDYDIAGFLSDEQREDFEEKARKAKQEEWEEQDAEEYDRYHQMKKDGEI